MKDTAEILSLYPATNSHVPLRAIGEVDDEQLRLFKRDGFLAIENVFPPAEVEAAKAGLSFLIGGGNAQFTGISFEAGVDVEHLSADQREAYVRKLMWFVDHEPRLAAISRKPVFVELVEKLVGSAVTMIQDMALLKPPHVGREKPWHQDTAYFAVEPLELILGTWIALDDATLENGCMHVIPGSHLAGPRPHYHERDCQLPDDVVDVARDVAVPLRAGGVMLFSGLLHHGTPPNRSAARRRALQFHYASVNCRKTDKQSHAEHFHDVAGYAACTGSPRPMSERH